MTEGTQNVLKWILIAGVVVSGGKIVYDLMKAPPPVTDTATKTETSTSASESASSDVDSILPRHPHSAQPATTDTAPPANTATTDASASASASASGSANAPAGSLPALLWQIAQDPKGNKPMVAQRDPQTGLFVFVYEALPGVDQPVLLVVPGDPTAWAWQLESDLTVEKLTGATKLDKLPPPRPGVTAVKIVGGPFDGSVAVLPQERPKLRLVKSPGFVKLEAEELKKQGAGGGGGAPPPGTGH